MNDAGTAANLESTRDDAWIPSSCALCYGSCSILAHRVDGVVVKIEGNPRSAVGQGRLCGKGVSGIMSHYDPNRLTRPLRRTNPRKGLDEDPRWKEISWEEALDEIATVLKRVRAEDPRKLVLQRTTTFLAAPTEFDSFASAFGTPNICVAGGGLHCGNGAHRIAGIMHSSWSMVPDFKYCNYAIYFGASKGHGAGHSATPNMAFAADARARGMKMVVVDPMCNFAGAKASEWVPLRVGTDAALALAMCNVLVNELAIYDAPFLQAKTNAPYLIGPDKLYVRDPQTRKPLVWDVAANAARPYTDASAADMALEGSFEANGVRCQPAFQKLKEHLRKFTPEWGEGITTVPAATIRRIAGEFGREARIGSTIVVEGVALPYRPVAAIAFRGPNGHKNSLYNCLAIDLLNELMGASDVVGGCIGFNPACTGFPETGRLRYVPSAGQDGLLKVGMWVAHHAPYPFLEPRMPQRIGLQDLFVVGQSSPFLESDDQDELWDRFELPYRPEVLLNVGANMLMSIANRESVARAVAKYKFIVSIDLFETETTRFADIALPDLGYLQQLSSRTSWPFFFCSMPGGLGDWSWTIRQPVLPPEGEQRAFQDVLLELADRIGMRADLNAAFNAVIDLAPEHRLQGERRYSWEEICDADLKGNFGPERGLEWFKQHGVVSWPKKPEEVYWRPFVDARVPIYWEFLTVTGEKIAAIADKCGFETPREYYEPLPDFLPCPSHCCKEPGFDLYGFYYRDSIHTNSFTMENPWLDEAAQLDPFSYTVAMNSDTGRKKGLRDGELVWVENEHGRKVKGRVKLTRAIHPEALGFAGCAGHWSRGMPVAMGKGVFFNDLLELDREHASPANLNLDLCVRVKVTPAASTA
ncbi:MAG: molybdenum enzyme, large subunit,related to phenylacetyl-CoA: acceptor oxidoreductase [Betaproteobacteria bacterium RIFCSPLOWO2_12_FULL_62_13b]|nr:MAG: molybdenum enzyme, large subunit,related to phenylacetyl-CoA: acceptor oxidoreductase [Betaproteobacteria bacterium RIFCSPLOWO2_12_FULL_62_13b]